MKRKRLGKSDIEVSVLTLGCMSLGTNQKEAERIIDSALDMGINHLDTADLYDYGLNEEIVGNAIQSKRNQLILTTKVGNHFNQESKDWFWDPSKEYIQSEVKESLKRLKTDYIDFYMLHGGTLDDPIDETIEAFEELKQEGLIRAYGISSIRPNVIREYVKRSSIDGVMTQYSLLDRRPEEETLDLLHANGISVLARGPLAKGMLSIHATSQIEKKGRDGFLDYTYEELKEIHSRLSTFSSYSINELALKYVIKHPAIASAVFGASTINQVIENTSFDTMNELEDKVYSELKNITKQNRYSQNR